MANIDLLNSAKTNLLTILVNITANPKPSYSVDGQNVSWSEYHSMLVEQLGKLNVLIQQEGSPIENITQGFS